MIFAVCSDCLAANKDRWPQVKVTVLPVTTQKWCRFCGAKHATATIETGAVRWKDGVRPTRMCRTCRRDRMRDTRQRRSAA